MSNAKRFSGWWAKLGAPKAKRRWAIALVMLGVIVGAVVAGWYAAERVFALEIADFKTERELRQAKVRRVETQGFSMLERMDCEPLSASSAPCSCAVLIHGLGDQATTWKRLLLAPPISGWRWIAPDLPGHGQSPPASIYRVSSLADALVSALTPLVSGERCARLVIVGNSLGGWIAGAMLKSALLIDGLALLGASGHAGRQDGAVELLTEPTTASLKAFQSKAYFQSREIPEHIWNLIVRRARSRAPISRAIVEANRSESDALTPAFFGDRSAALRAQPPEVLTIWGQADQIVSRREVQELAQNLSEVVGAAHVHSVEIPECGHLPQKECLKPLAAALSPFLNQAAQRLRSAP